MSGHLRSCFAAFLFVGLSISPASSNLLTDLFSAGSKEAPAIAPAPAQECSPRPGKVAAGGQHWVYRSEARRKCWFQTAERVVAAMRKPLHHYVVKHRVTSPERREAAIAKRKADADAHAEVLRSRPAVISQQTPTAPEQLKESDAPSGPTVKAAAEPPPSVADSSSIDQVTPDRPASRLVNVEMLRVKSSTDSTIGSTVLPATPIAFPVAETGDAERGWASTQLGVVLMALGLIAVLSASLPMLFGI